MSVMLMRNIRVIQRQTVTTPLGAIYVHVSMDTVVMARTVKVEY